ncbi:hypothetical protein A4A49_56684, partial [Nicotiana attenuata]
LIQTQKRQRVSSLFRLIEFCIVLVIISRFSTQLPLTFKLSTEYFRGLGVTLVSPRFFVLGNAIVIILFFKSGQSSSNSTNNVKIDLYDEYKQKCITNKDAYCKQNKKQTKQSILVQEAYCERSKKQSILVQRKVEKKFHRSHSKNFNSLSHDDIKPRKELIRSATIGCQSIIYTDSVKSVSYREDEMSSEEFKSTVEAFIARQQRFLREEEFS